MLLRRLLTPSALALVLPLVLAAGARAEDRAPSAWESPGVIAQALDAAVAAVEAVCGARFVSRPSARRSTADDVQRALEAELAEALAAPGGRELLPLAQLSRSLLAKYAPDEQMVHVLPENVAHIAAVLADPELLSADVLRVVMAHEVAHALDFQRFPDLDRRRRELASRPEAAAAAGAVIEGHAQWVAERVARRWDLLPAFQRFTRSISALPEGLDAGAALIARTLAAEFTFAYVKGHAFCEAVDKALGRAGLDRALADPPLTPGEIEHPERWLDPARSPAGADLTPHLDALAALTTGEGWQGERHSLRLTHLEAQLAVLPEADRAAALAGFQDGRVGVWQREVPQGFVAAAVMRFDGPEAAKRFIATSRAISKAKDAQLAEGALRVVSAAYEPLAGLDDDLGFGATKRVTVPGLGERDYVSLVLAHGLLVYEVTVFEPDEAQRASLASLPSEIAKLAALR